MIAIALAALAHLGPGSFAPDLDAFWPDAWPEPAFDRRDACGGREGWVGDGDDGRSAPACDGPDADVDTDAAGLHAPDWLRLGEEGADPDGPEP